MSVPELIIVKRWRCPFCRRSRSSKAATAEHVARCWLNPSVRSCKTCANYLREEAGEPCFPSRPCNCNDGYEECSAGVELPEGAGFPVTGCALWTALEAS